MSRPTGRCSPRSNPRTSTPDGQTFSTFVAFGDAVSPGQHRLRQSAAPLPQETEVVRAHSSDADETHVLIGAVAVAVGRNWQTRSRREIERLDHVKDSLCSNASQDSSLIVRSQRCTSSTWSQQHGYRRPGRAMETIKSSGFIGRSCTGAAGGRDETSRSR